MTADAPSMRKKILDTAADAVLRDRNVTHGAVENTFAVIADLWNAYLDAIRDPATGHAVLTPHDAAAMLALLKIARITQNPEHEDNWTDLAGYAACGGELAVLPTRDFE